MEKSYRFLISNILKISSIRFINIFSLLVINYIIVTELPSRQGAEYYIFITAVAVISALLRFGINAVFVNNAPSIKLYQKDRGIFFSCCLFNVLIAILLIAILNGIPIPNSEIMISYGVITAICKNINLFASEILRIFDKQFFATICLDLIQNVAILVSILYIIKFGELNLNLLVNLILFSSIFSVIVSCFLLKEFIQYSLSAVNITDFNVFSMSHIYISSLLQALTDFFITQVLLVNFGALIATSFGFCSRMLAVVNVVKQSLVQLYSTKLKIAFANRDEPAFNSYAIEIFKFSKILAAFLIILLFILWMYSNVLSIPELDINIVIVMSVIAVLNLYIGPIGTFYLVMSREKEILLHVMFWFGMGWALLLIPFWFGVYNAIIGHLSLALLLSGQFVSLRVNLGHKL